MGGVLIYRLGIHSMVFIRWVLGLGLLVSRKLRQRLLWFGKWSLLTEGGVILDNARGARDTTVDEINPALLQGPKTVGILL